MVYPKYHSYLCQSAHNKTLQYILHLKYRESHIRTEDLEAQEYYKTCCNMDFELYYQAMNDIMANIVMLG